MPLIFITHAVVAVHEYFSWCEYRVLVSSIKLDMQITDPRARRHLRVRVVFVFVIIWEAYSFQKIINPFLVTFSEISKLMDGILDFLYPSLEFGWRIRSTDA